MILAASERGIWWATLCGEIGVSNVMKIRKTARTYDQEIPYFIIT